jgi:hypothetical protein
MLDKRHLVRSSHQSPPMPRTPGTDRRAQRSEEGLTLDQNNDKETNKGKARKPRPRVKKRNWREALNALKSDETYENLLSIERTAKPVKEVDQRRRVPIKELIVAEKVFQWRGQHSDFTPRSGTCAS